VAPSPPQSTVHQFGSDASVSAADPVGDESTVFVGCLLPGGKTQLVTEAIDVALVDLFGDLERPLGDTTTFPEALSVIVASWRRLLVDYDFAMGCPLAATICDAADNDDLRTFVEERFAWWRRVVADAYTRFGATQPEAEHTRRC
jgi:hypothetical protein